MSVSLIFILIFFLIIAMLVVVAFYGSKKEKIRHQKDLIKKRKDDELSRIKHKELYIKLYFLLNSVEDDVKTFDSRSKIISLGEINSHAQEKIKEIKNSDDLKAIYIFEERKEEFKPIIDELSKIKPIKWHLESTYAYNLINAKGAFLISDQQNTELLALAKDWLNK